MAVNMTEGNILKNLIKFSIPLILSGIMHQLYNWADSFIVGNVEGQNALASIGTTTYINAIFMVIIIGFTMGLSILAGQQYGRGEDTKLVQDLSTFTIVLGGISIIVTILGYLSSNSILNILHTPEEIFKNASDYLKIIMIGIPFIAVYNIYSAVLRGMGDSKAPMYSILISTIINIFLDIVFVYYFRFGVKGAAFATVFSQIIMAIFIIFYTVKTYEYLKFRIEKNSVDIVILKEGIKLGLPVAIQSSVNSIGYLALQNFMNGFGVNTVAAITTCYKADSLVMMPIHNLSSSISTFVAQNIGAKNTKRAKECVNTGLKIMATMSLLLAVIMLFVGVKLIYLFGLRDESLEIGRNYFISECRFYVILGIGMTFKGYLEGGGDVKFTSVVGVLTLMIQIVFSYILVGFYSNMVIAYAEGYAWTFETVLFIIRYLLIKKSKII